MVLAGPGTASSCSSRLASDGLLFWSCAGKYALFEIKVFVQLSSSTMGTLNLLSYSMQVPSCCGDLLQYVGMVQKSTKDNGGNSGTQWRPLSHSAGRP